MHMAKLKYILEWPQLAQFHAFCYLPLALMTYRDILYQARETGQPICPTT